MIDIKKLNQLIADKYISVQKHPDCDLWIYNYTEKCQYERMWIEETTMCRGLILDKDYKIIARPFRKFWNYEEHIGEDSKLPPIPVEEFEVYDKMDGSLGVLYHLPDGTPQLATRGSFVSDQAIEGTKILHEKLRQSDRGFTIFDPRFTWLFEVVYPDNRIVVDYGGVRELYLLACIDTLKDDEVPLSVVQCDVFPKVKRFDGVTDLSKISQIHRDNAEGFVIRFKSGVRVKIKYEEYTRLHRLVTGVNAKTIWDLLRHGQPFDELLERVPDEFYSWVKNTKSGLEEKFTAVKKVAQKIHDEVENLPYRKEQAMAVMQNPDSRQYSGIIFKMLDKKPYDEIIWKMIRPAAEKPFRGGVIEDENPS